MRLLEKAETPGYDSRANNLEAGGSRVSPGVQWGLPPAVEILPATSRDPCVSESKGCW